MTAAQDKRIAELEVDLARVNVHVRYLESELAATPTQSAELAQRDERIASLEAQLAQYVGTARQMVREVVTPSRFSMPTMQQFDALLRIVYGAYPKFTPKPGHDRRSGSRPSAHLTISLRYHARGSVGLANTRMIH